MHYSGGHFIEIRRGSALAGIVVLLLVSSASGWGYLVSFHAVPAAAPLHERLIVLDPGHGGPDPGAVSSDGLLEKDVVLDISVRLRRLLESCGYRVIMTRETDTDLGGASTSLRERKQADLRQRVQIINASGADAVISIHANAIASSRWCGAQVFCRPDRAPESEILARCIQEELVHITGETTRDVNVSDGQFVLQKTWLPAVNVEVGFLSNPREARLLADPRYQDKVAWAIMIGTARYFGMLSEAGPGDPGKDSALRELTRLARFLQTVLAAFLHPRVPGEKTHLLQARPQLGLGDADRPGNTVPDGTSLPRYAPAVNLGKDVIF